MTLPIRVRLAQISQRVGANYYLPYSVGLLQAHAQKFLRAPERYQFLTPLYRRMDIPAALEAFKSVDVAGFSVYVWNIRRSLMIAEALKCQAPDTLIIFGGPQVPDDCEAFLREHSFIDLCVHGEGETVFTDLLERLPERDWQDLPGVSWLAGDAFRHQPPAPRARNLDEFPSPFLEGVFDPLLAEHDHWFTTFETNRGCPFSCTFCDWGSAIASKVVRFPESRLVQEIEWLGLRRMRNVFCADANFGILPRDVELARQVAEVRQKHGFPLAFQIQTAKNVTGRVIDVQKILTGAGLSGAAAISLQSLNAGALKAIKRENISLAAYAQIQQACREQGIFAYTDIIMGLPGETYKSFVAGIETVISHGQFNKIIFHDATLLPNAEMAQPDYRARYGIETAEVLIPAHTVPADGVPELMEIVIATSDLPREDWVRLHVFAWMTAFLFYTHKLLQPVLIVLQAQLGCSWSELIELFCAHDAVAGYPLLEYVRAGFEQSARRQQQGYPESERDNLVMTPEEGLYLTPDLTLQLRLAGEGRLDQFYREAGQLLARFAFQRRPDFDLGLLSEALLLNRRFFIQHYRQQGFPLTGVSLNPEPVNISYNLPDYVQARLSGRDCELKPGPRQVVTL